VLLAAAETALWTTAGQNSDLSYASDRCSFLRAAVAFATLVGACETVPLGPGERLQAVA